MPIIQCDGCGAVATHWSVLSGQRLCAQCALRIALGPSVAIPPSQITCDKCGNDFHPADILNMQTPAGVNLTVCWGCAQQYPKGPACRGCGIIGRPLNMVSGLCLGCVKLNAAAQTYKSRHKGGGVAYPKRYSGSNLGSSAQSVSTPSTRTQCTFAWDIPRGAYSVKCEFNPNFIEFMKAKIPGSDRSYDPGNKIWYIKDAWFDIMYELASQLWPGGGVAVITRAQAELAWKQQEDARKAMLVAQRQAVLGPLESALLDFCDLCDVDALRKSRNAMAIALHPDKGGDPERMARLNASWYIVETELKKKESDK